MRGYKKEIISWKREGDTTATKYKVIKVAFVPTGGFRPFRDEIHVILITRIQPTTPWIGMNTEWFCAVKIKIYFTATKRPLHPTPLLFFNASHEADQMAYISSNTQKCTPYAFLKNAGAPGYSLHFFLCSIFMFYFFISIVPNTRCKGNACQSLPVML